MQSIQTLIDRAAEACGSDAELARRLGVGRSMVANMRAGRTPVPLAVAGEMALLAGIDPLRAIQAVAMQELGKTERGQKVRAAIEKAFLVLALAICCFFADDSSAHGTSTNPAGCSVLSEQIAHRIYMAVRAMLKRLWFALRGLRSPAANGSRFPPENSSHYARAGV
jgi:DNA-binding transcriptional regulator YdaS (Cro superfamily)